MTDDPRVQRLLDELLDSQATPEEVCRSCPELLPVVSDRWWQMRHLLANLDAMFPPPDAPIAERPEGIDLPMFPGHEVEGILGRGGMGVVFRAQHLQLNRPVALKMVLAGAYAGRRERERFQREAEAAAGLRHPNVVQVYDVGESDGRPYLTMELVDGGNLAQKLAGTPQPARQAAEMVAILAGAVHAAHGLGIVHRDLKPSNVLLTADGTPKISDFGLARRLDNSASLTRTGVALGTPSYMAPEQARGPADSIGPATDVYALGAILYECLTGRPPFRAETALETVRQVTSQEPVTPSRLNDKVPRDLDAVCLKCLEKDPRRRYPSAATLAEDLRRFLSGRPTVARPAGRLERGWRWCRRNPRETGLIGLSLVVAVLAGGGTWWVDRQRVASRAEQKQHEIRTRQGVARALAQAEVLRGRARWAEAHDALEQAALLAEADGVNDLRPRVDEARRDLRMAAELDRILQAIATLVDGDLDRASAPPAFMRAFREYGLAVTEGDPVDLARRIRTSEIKQEMVDALDHWALWEPDEAIRLRLAAVARAADPDPWRDRARDPAVWKDTAALEDVARTARVAEQPVRLLVTLGERLPWAAGAHPELLTNLGASAVGLSATLGGAGPLLAVGTLSRAEPGPPDFLRLVQREHPDDFWANFKLGIPLVKWNPGQAAGYFRAALAARPTSVAAHNNLGLALRDSGQIEEAIRCFERALRIDPTEPLLHNNLGVSLTAAGRRDEAISRFQEAIRLNPALGGAHNNLASELSLKGLQDEAIEHYRKAVRFRPKDTNVHVNLAVALATANRVDEAIDHYRDALSLGPRDAMVHVGLGAVLHIRGRLDEAIDQYEQALRINPLLAEAHHHLGSALLDKRRPDEAVDHFRAALRLDPNNAKAHYGLGNARKAKGRLPDAIDEYRQALRLDPNLAAAHYNLANTLRATGHVDEAIDHFRETSRVDPTHANAYGALGQALLEKGLFGESRAATRRCLDLLAPGDQRRAMAQQQLQSCDDLLALEGRLPGVLRGEDKPADAAELLELARICHLRKRYAAAARLAADAFAVKPQLADDVQSGSRYNAACAAALVGSGRGEDGGELSAAERARWRGQARRGIRDDLAVWNKKLDGDPAAKLLVQKTMMRWRADPDLEGLRQPDALDHLPVVEREDCIELWKEVAALLNRAQSSK
jgi:eukaryotic-like serine/threonine-protein kinase